MISLKDIDKDTNRLKAQADGRSNGASQQKVLWSAMFSHSLDGRRGLPYVLVSEPGTVKTSSVKWLARKAGLYFESVLGSIRQPMDFMGCPIPQRTKLTAHNQHLSPDGDEEFLHMHYAPAGFAVRAAEARNGLILFDEANNMPPAVQSAMLRVLFEGVAGELQIPPGIRFLLATNSVEDAAGGWDISNALANRMGWIEWEGASVDRFTGYLAASGGRGQPDIQPIDPRAEEAAVDARWADAWMKSSMLVTGFLKAKSGSLHIKSTDPTKKAWPSCRTWDFMAHALAGSFIYDLNGLERQIACAGFIGSDMYSEFFAYAKDADLPDPAKLLDGDVAWKHNPGRIDRTAAVLSGCVAKVVAPDAEKQAERCKALWELFEALPDDATDVMMPHVSALIDKRMLQAGGQVGYRVLARVDPVMTAADFGG